MQGYVLFLCLLGVYLSGLVAIGLYFTRQQHSITDFWLAGRRIGPLNTGFSAAASWLTAGALLAVIGFFMLSGMGSIWGFVAPNILALLIIALLVKRIKHLPSITQPELLEQRYGKGMRAPVAIIITIVMILFAVADIKGFAFLLQVYYGLSPAWAAAIVAVSVSLYVTLGGLSAVVWTDLIQYIFLATFTIAMAAVTAGAAMSVPETPTVSFGNLLSSTPEGWWTPLSIGLPMVLIFCLAIIPGWISEQDPWQRVWAARNESAARRGMVLGAFLIMVVFGACAVIAIALSRLYPEIAAMGFPAGMAKAEPALLDFIRNNGFSDFTIALTAIGLAAAAMSCADTFAASGASCLSRDIYQRFIRPDATMGQMLRINRISVLVIVLAATAASFAIDSIIDAIHIATFIASAAYFFPLMGGLYWKRATRQGAITAMVIGGTVQIVLVIIDLVKTAPMAPPFLETLHPIMMGHGVILGMGLSAAAFIGVSLATQPVEALRLAPFFADTTGLVEARGNGVDTTSPEYQQFLGQLHSRMVGDRTQLHLTFRRDTEIDWTALVSQLQQTFPAWISPAGIDSVYRLTRPDMLACVTLTRGTGARELWFKAEPRNGAAAELKQEMYLAMQEVAMAH